MWLASQLEKCYADPDRYVKPTCSAIAYELYRNSPRWREIRQHLEALIEGGSA
jgi:hypothetical protein